MNELLVPILEYAIAADERDGPARPRQGAARIDLHCHSTFSNEYVRFVPGLVFHPLLEPWEVYDLAKKRGMDYVTLTDHDTIDGCLALLERRGDLPDFIIGEEVSVAFPEDGTVVHVNVFDINEAQHREIQRLGGNIYHLVDYLRRIGKLYVINHLTWTKQHRVLDRRKIEIMLDLFPVFEALNGTRGYAHNAFAWHVAHAHGKALVAGSDSHTHRVGTTYTLSAGETRGELLANLRAGRTALCGAFGTPEKLREDVWITLNKNAERRIAAATSAWERTACRLARALGDLTYPIACLGYHIRQNLLIRAFARELPA